MHFGKNPHQIRNNSTIRNESTTTTSPLLRNKSNEWRLGITKIASALAENVWNDRNHRNHQSSTPISLPAGEKTAKIGRVLFEQIGPEGAVQTGSSFGCAGSPEGITDGAIRQKKNFLYFLSGACAYLSSFWSYGEKNEIAENENWLPWQRTVHWKFENRGSGRSCTAIAEPNGENRVKIVQWKPK